MARPEDRAMLPNRPPAPLPPGEFPAVPSQLRDAILAGDCVAFVGAGFSAAAGLPRWKDLLSGIAERARFAPDDQARFAELLTRGGGHALDQAAQLLEDHLRREDLVRFVIERMAAPNACEAMERRLWYLRRIPFRAILTTNFDGLLPGMAAELAAYFKVLHPEHYRWWEETFWGEDERWPTIVKLHGNLEERDLVLTRRDYRRRLYENSAYTTFLRATLSTTTVLYLGFSFEDAYLNELRSEVLAMLAPGEKSPLAYAVADNVPRPTVDLFRKHEGIAILPYRATDNDFSGFDRFLEALYRETNPLPRFARLLGSRRLLWVDANPDNNAAGLSFLERAAAAGGRPSIQQVLTCDAGLAALEGAARTSPFDLVITHWGEPRAPGARPVAVKLLEEMRRRDLRAPVMVFSKADDTGTRRRTAMCLGALGYFDRFEDLFQEMERVFASPA